jgi:hypothetical protein
LCRRLRIADEWILRNLERPAGGIRHGQVVPVSDADRCLAFQSARTLIQRFIALVYLAAGELPASEYPELN